MNNEAGLLGKIQQLNQTYAQEDTQTLKLPALACAGHVFATLKCYQLRVKAMVWRLIIAQGASQQIRKRSATSSQKNELSPEQRGRSRRSEHGRSQGGKSRQGRSNSLQQLKMKWETVSEKIQSLSPQKKETNPNLIKKDLLKQITMKLEYKGKQSSEDLRNHNPVTENRLVKLESFMHKIKKERQMTTRPVAVLARQEVVQPTPSTIVSRQQEKEFKEVFGEVNKIKDEIQQMRRANQMFLQQVSQPMTAPSPRPQMQPQQQFYPQQSPRQVNYSPQPQPPSHFTSRKRESRESQRTHSARLAASSFPYHHPSPPPMAPHRQSTPPWAGGRPVIKFVNSPRQAPLMFRHRP